MKLLILFLWLNVFSFSLALFLIIFWAKTKQEKKKLMTKENDEQNSGSTTNKKRRTHQKWGEQMQKVRKSKAYIMIIKILPTVIALHICTYKYLNFLKYLVPSPVFIFISLYKHVSSTKRKERNGKKNCASNSFLSLLFYLLRRQNANRHRKDDLIYYGKIYGWIRKEIVFEPTIAVKRMYDCRM